MSDDKRLEDRVVQISPKAVEEGWERTIKRYEWKASQLREKLTYLKQLNKNPMVEVYGLYNRDNNEYFYLDSYQGGSKVQHAIDILTGVKKE